MNEARVLARVDKLLGQGPGGFGTDMLLLPFDGLAGSSTPYKDRKPKFKDAVSLVGRAIRNPTKEQISFIGNMAAVEIAFVWSREELRRKFPAAAEGQWITGNDRVTFEGETFRLDIARPSGRYKMHNALFIALGTKLT